MNEVQLLARQGFSLAGKNNLDLAFLSLRIALKSYFSTYHSIRNRFHFDNVGIEETFKREINYCESCAETIIHFQHFFELVIKDILRQDHMLLASRVYSHPDILHKILHNQNISTEEEQKVFSVEFSDALKTLCKLIQTQQIQCFQDVQFIKENRSTLEELNTLRNRVWHRGAFFLHYKKLDEFVGKYVLPIVFEITNLPQYNDIGSWWKHKHADCGIDPVGSIRLEYLENPTPCVGKIALLKEIGRAAYNNPLHDKKIHTEKRDERISKIEDQIQELKKQGKEIPKRLIISKKMADMSYGVIMQLDSPYIKKAIKISKLEAEEDLFNIVKCPVCGVESFILYDESDFLKMTIQVISLVTIGCIVQNVNAVNSKLTLNLK